MGVNIKSWAYLASKWYSISALGRSVVFKVGVLIKIKKETYSYVRDRTIAEDFVMESFMYYWEHKETLTKDSNIPAYILVTIKNKALNYLHHIEIVDTACVRIKTHSQWKFLPLL